MPGDDERRPRPEAPPTPTTTSIMRRHCSATCIHGKSWTRFCQPCVTRRRVFARQLDDLLAELYPKAPAEPSTFSLTDAELRRHGNDLHIAGWSIEEILTVLAIGPAS